MFCIRNGFCDPENITHPLSAGVTHVHISCKHQGARHAPPHPPDQPVSE